MTAGYLYALSRQGCVSTHVSKNEETQSQKPQIVIKCDMRLLVTDTKYDDFLRTGMTDGPINSVNKDCISSPHTS